MQTKELRKGHEEREMMEKWGFVNQNTSTNCAGTALKFSNTYFHSNIYWPLWLSSHLDNTTLWNNGNNHLIKLNIFDKGMLCLLKKKKKSPTFWMSWMTSKLSERFNSLSNRESFRFDLQLIKKLNTWIHFLKVFSFSILKLFQALSDWLEQPF